MPAERLIAGFIDALRGRGLRLSPAEQIDASRAALAVGVESRSRFRSALSVTLAKSPEERAVFDEAFEAYFAPPRGSAGRTEGSGASAEGGFRGRGRPAEPDPERSRPGRPSRPAGPPQRPAIAGRAPRQRSIERRRPGSIPPAAGREEGREGRRGRLRQVLAPRKGDAVARDLARERAQVRSRQGEASGDPRRRDLVVPATGEEEARLASLVASIIREIRLRKGRRFARGPRGRLWVKRLVRESLAHGGVPFVLPMRERRPRRPRLLVLADVSHSVIRAAGLFLLICRGLQERLGRISIHLFVDRVAEATEAVGRWSPTGGVPKAPGVASRRGASPGEGLRPHAGAASFAEIVGGLPHLDPAAPSDYGRAFYHARSVLLRSGTRDTVLVVLGDARTNRRDPLAWAFEEIAARCRRVLWLNPEPRSLWDSGDSVMSAYLPSCDVVCEVRDVEALAAGVREILRSL